jgi:hypothetical protein
MKSLATLGLFALILSGCAGLSKEQHLLCPYDTVWQAAVDTMRDRPLTEKDKYSGVIETAWTEMAAAERRFGIFQRAAFDNKERTRLTLELTREKDGTTVNVTEIRERWHLKGGVTSQATRWWPVEPSEEAMSAVLNRINTKLKEQGCTVS